MTNLTLIMPNFLNGIIHLPFLALSIIIFRDIKMKTWSWSASLHILFVRKLIVCKSPRCLSKLFVFKLNIKINMYHLINPYPTGNQMWLVFATSIQSSQPVHPCSLARLYIHLGTSPVPKMECGSFHLRKSAG